MNTKMKMLTHADNFPNFKYLLENAKTIRFTIIRNDAIWLLDVVTKK